MALSYSFKSAFRSLYREKWINILSVFTVASNLFIITLAAFFLYNIELIASNLPERFSIVAYFKDDLSQEETLGILDSLKKRDDILSLKYISKEDAMNDLKKTLGDTSYILEGLSENPLLSSVEIRVKKDFVTSDTVTQISDEIKKMPGIDTVHYGEKIAEAIHLLKRSINNISIIIFLAISSGVIFVIYSTVKILFYRRKEEIEIIKLLGATKGFIRKPFLIEGGVIGFFGGGFVVIGALFFYFAVTYRLSMVIPIFKTLTFPMEILMLLPIIGTTLGIIGSIIALGRLKL